MSAGADGQAAPAGRAARAVRSFTRAYFAYVMAVGIVSTVAYSAGPSWLSLALLAAACAGLAVLGAALAVRLLYFRPMVTADIRPADRVFGFFIITAGLDVPGVRFILADHPLVTAVLVGVAAGIWLLLTYGVPASLLLTRARDSVLGRINGSWLLWIVATQSLSIAAAILIPAWRSQSGLPTPVAAGMWSVGVVIYLMVSTLILLRWLGRAPTSPPCGASSSRSECTASRRWTSGRWLTWPSWSPWPASCSG